MQTPRTFEEKVILRFFFPERFALAYFTSRICSLPGVAGPGRRIEQVIGDLRFDATQTEVMEVVSDLESSPWIDAVSSLRLTRLEGRMIRVNLSLEAWVNSRDERRARQ